MSARQAVLFVCHRIPYPPDKGDKIRSWRLLQFLAGRYDVHLACFVDDPADFEHHGFLDSVCESVALLPLNPKLATLRSARGFLSGAPLSASYYDDIAMSRVVDRLRQLPLAAEVVFSSTMAPYIEKQIGARARIVDFCDADSEKWTDYAQTARGPMRQIYAREGRKLRELENTIANWAEASFASTADEASRFNVRPEISRRVEWWANGVDTNYFDPDLPHATIPEAPEIVFTGAMDYRANVEAGLFFIDHVWPKVKAGAPDAEVAFVGARPDAKLRVLDGKDGVRVTGRVDEIRPWLAQAKISVAPLRVARGIQNKVLEAMAMARPVVATSAAATGIDARPGEALIVADEPAQFAGEILDLLSSHERRESIGRKARSCVIERYDWDAQLEKFACVMDRLIGQSFEGSEAPADRVETVLT